MKRLFTVNLLLLAIASIIAPAALAADDIDLNGDGAISVHERRLDFLSPGGGA